MSASMYDIPDSPVDPEAAALELIVRAPVEIYGGDAVPREAYEALQDLSSVLSAERAFAGMSWHDAKHAAVAIVVDATARDDGADSLRQRAERVRAGTDGMVWDDREAMVRALTTGAQMLDL